MIKLLRQALVLTAYAGLMMWLLSPLAVSWWLGLGVAIGGGLFWFDEAWLWQWYSPKLEQSRPQLISRSSLALVVYSVLAIWLVTSSGSLIGIGLIMALLISWVDEAWWPATPEQFHHRFGMYLKRPLTLNEIKTWRLLVAGWVTILSVWLAL